MEELKNTETIDTYMAGFPPEVQRLMEQVRESVHRAVPGSGEKLSWDMPTFTWKKKILVQFAGHTHHLGFYPHPSGILAFHKDLEGYKTTKGGVQFPYDKPIPQELIEKMARFRRQEIEEATPAK